MLYALEERNVYKKSIIDDELRSANMAIAKTAFALVKGAVSIAYASRLSIHILTMLL